MEKLKFNNIRPFPLWLPFAVMIIIAGLLIGGIYLGGCWDREFEEDGGGGSLWAGKNV